MMRKLLLLISGLIGVGWIGINIKPKPFTKYIADTPDFDKIPLPANLPEPVYRFYQTIVGDELPIICSAVITGRAVIRLGGIPFKGRIRFTHRAGYDYRHYIELTWFGQPIMKVNESYCDGKMRMELPSGTFDNIPEYNLAANQAIWGEAFWFPSLYVTDRRVRWEAVDPMHANLIVPNSHSKNEPEQVFNVTFDPDTHLIQEMETIRYRESDEPPIRWILYAKEWTGWHGMLIPSVSAVRWEDQDKPWLTVTLDDVVYNADINQYIMERGL